jgi:hypothetical protein
VAISVVRDSKTNDLIVKLVNLLPVAVNSSIDIKNYNFVNQEVVKIVLKGDPSDKNAKPVVSSCPVSELKNVELPAYSFTVYRIKSVGSIK